MTTVTPTKKLLTNSPRDESICSPAENSTLMLTTNFKAAGFKQAKDKSANNSFCMDDDSILADLRMMQSDQMSFKAVQHQQGRFETALMSRFVSVYAARSQGHSHGLL